METDEIPGCGTIWVFERNMQPDFASFLEQHDWKINNAGRTVFIETIAQKQH